MDIQVGFNPTNDRFNLNLWMKFKQTRVLWCSNLFRQIFNVLIFTNNLLFWVDFSFPLLIKYVQSIWSWLISELDRIVNMDRIPNTELFGFWKFYKYWIPNYSFFWKWMNTEYRIVLFGLNYSNTEYLKLNSISPQKILYVNFVT